MHSPINPISSNSANHPARLTVPNTGRLPATVHLLTLLIVLFFLQLNSAFAASSDLEGVSLVFSAEFQRSQDKNADRQPDGWTRRKDREHPSFIRSGINVRDVEAAKKAKEAELTLAKLHHAWKTRSWNPDYIPEVIPPKLAELIDRTILNDCYEVRMDGGQYELVSPRFDLDTRYDYVLQCELDCKELKSHKAQVEIRIYQRNGNLISTFATGSVTGSQQWQTVRTSIIALADEGTVRGEIAIRVSQSQPQFGRGIARFDNIQLQRMPTLTIKSTVANNIAEPGTTVDFACFAAGLSSSTTNIQLEISDIDGNIVRREVKALSRQEGATIPSGRFTSTSRLRSNSKSEKSFAVFSHAFDRAGLYKIDAKVGHSRRQVMIAVLDNTPVDRSPFGISLPTLPRLNEVDSVVSLAQSAHLGWIKVPVWFEEHDLESAKSSHSLLKTLRSLSLRTVARLDGPPVSQHVLFEEDPAHSQAVSHLQNAKVWEPLLDPIFTQLNSYIDYVQLGDDHDTSFMLTKNSQAVIEKVRGVFQYYFQDPKLVVAWDWLMPTSQESESDINTFLAALQFSTHTPLTATELGAYATHQVKHRTKTWVSIDPLPSSTYELTDRIEDLLEKMINVKVSGVQAAFLLAPFDPEVGILDSQRTPTELLVPWSQIAAAIGSRSSVGSIELPSGSRNITFKGQSKDVMILWSSRPVVEQFFFGDKVSAMDVWGREIPVSENATADGCRVQSIPVGKWPVLVYGVDCDLVRWRQEFQLLVDHLTSNLSSDNSLPIRSQNTFSKRAKGSVTLSCDSLLKGGKSIHPIDLEPGRVERLDIPIELRTDASAGSHKIDFQFKLLTDKEYNFSLTRSLNLGHPNIEFQWNLIRLNRDTVEARVELTNKTGQVIDFDCTLFPPGQSYLRIPMFNCSPGTTTLRQRLSIPERDSQAKGSIWIRCEQVRSPLTLNYLVREELPDRD